MRLLPAYDDRYSLVTRFPNHQVPLINLCLPALSLLCSPPQRLRSLCHRAWQVHRRKEIHCSEHQRQEGAAAGAPFLLTRCALFPPCQTCPECLLEQACQTPCTAESAWHRYELWGGRVNMVNNQVHETSPSPMSPSYPPLIHLLPLCPSAG